MKAKLFIKKLRISFLTSLPFICIFVFPTRVQADTGGTVEEVTPPLTKTGDNILMTLCAGFAILVLVLMCIILYLLLTRRRDQDNVFYP